MLFVYLFYLLYGWEILEFSLHGWLIMDFFHFMVDWFWMYPLYGWLIMDFSIIRLTDFLGFHWYGWLILDVPIIQLRNYEGFSPNNKSNFKRLCVPLKLFKQERKNRESYTYIKKTFQYYFFLSNQLFDEKRQSLKRHAIMTDYMICNKNK